MPSDEIEKGDKGKFTPPPPSPRSLSFPSIAQRIIITTLLTLFFFCADTVSWNWGSGHPSGKVVETATEGELAIKSKRGNTIKKNASPSNPAVHVGRSGNDVVKRASELTVEEKTSGSRSGAKENGDSKKRERDAVDDGEGEGVKEADGDKVEGEGDADVEEEKEKEPEVKKPEAKKQKKEPATKKKAAAKGKKAAPAKKEKEEKTQVNGDGEVKKGRGRPKGTAASGGAATGGSKKKRAAKPRATEGIGSRTRSRN